MWHRVPVSRRCLLFNNKNATDWAAEKMISDGNRHIDICYMKVRERVAKGEILPEWIKGKSNSSDLLTKMVAKDVVDALMKTLQGIEPIPGVTTRDIKETGNAEKLLLSVMRTRQDGNGRRRSAAAPYDGPTGDCFRAGLSATRPW